MRPVRLDTTYIPDDAPCLVACSGGADSTALLLLVCEAAAAHGWRPAVAHLDHGMRPGSAADAAWVRELCEGLGVPLFFEHRDIPVLRRGGESLEAAARRVRYAFLKRAARLIGPGTVILTGHTADDQVETVALRLERRSGLRGLRGILPARRDAVVRPLLGARARDLRDLLRARGQRWREDPTNTDPAYRRNLWRSRLASLPPEALDELTRVAMTLTTEARTLHDLLTRLGTLFVVRPEKGAGHPGAGARGGLMEGEILLERPPAGFDLPHLAGASLDAAIQAAGGDTARIGRELREQLQSILLIRDPADRGPGLIQLGRRLWAESVVEGLLFSRSGGPHTGAFAPVPVRGSALSDEWVYPLPRGGILEVRPAEADQIEGLGAGRLPEGLDGRYRTVVPVGTGSGGLSLRYVEPGDAMRPFGMEGHRKLKELLRESGVPRLRRRRLPVLERSGTILWVGGVRTAEEARIGAQTRNALQFHFRPV